MPFTPRLLRTARRVLLGLAVVATVLALVVAIENWRGNRAWKKYAAEQTAKGMNLTELPKPSILPAATNFMATPVLGLLWEKPDSPALRSFYANHEVPKQHASNAFYWRKNQTLDFVYCIERYAADRKPRGLSEITPATTPAATLLALQQPLEPVFEELRRAAQDRAESQLVRPQSMSRENPFGVIFTPFPFIRALTSAQAAHACASLELKQPNSALLDTLAVLKFARGLAEAPDALLVETMIATVCTSYALQPVWEGLQKHAWNDAQLVLLERELARANLPDSLQRSLGTERVAATLIMDQLNRRDFSSEETKRARMTVFYYFFPSGWIQQNKVIHGQWCDRVHDALASRESPGFLSKLQHMDDLPDGFGSAFSPYSLLVAHIVPAHKKVAQNAIQKQSFISLALTACALERHWLAHGKYPETLAELVPTYLGKVPLDLIDGQPLRYRRTDDGKFVLYSIGLDGKDDGGKPAPSSDTDARGDWVWPQPAAANP